MLARGHTAECWRLSISDRGTGKLERLKPTARFRKVQMIQRFYCAIVKRLLLLAFVDKRTFDCSYLASPAATASCSVHINKHIQLSVLEDRPSAFACSCTCACMQGRLAILMQHSLLMHMMTMLLHQVLFTLVLARSFCFVLCLPGPLWAKAVSSMPFD